MCTFACATFVHERERVLVEIFGLFFRGLLHRTQRLRNRIQKKKVLQNLFKKGRKTMNANLEQIKQEIMTGSEALTSPKEVYEFKKSYLDGKTGKIGLLMKEMKNIAPEEHRRRSRDGSCPRCPDPSWSRTWWRHPSYTGWHPPAA